MGRPQFQRMLIKCHIAITVCMGCIAGKQTVFFFVFFPCGSHIHKGFVRQTQHSLGVSAVSCRANIERLGDLLRAIIMAHRHRSNMDNAVYGENVQQYTKGNQSRGDHGACAEGLFPKSFADGLHRLQHFCLQIVPHIAANLFNFCARLHALKFFGTLGAIFKMFSDKCARFLADHVFQVQRHNITDITALIFHVRFPPICFVSSFWLGGR